MEELGVVLQTLSPIELCGIVERGEVARPVLVQLFLKYAVDVV